MDRSKFLGGSDAAGVLGLSRWATPLSVWAEKTGQYVRADEDTEAMELGRELEDYVAKRFCRKTGKNVARADRTFFHPAYDFLGANVDRVVVSEEAGLECKTCSAWKAKEWEGDEIPREYIIQCYHYMMVTGLKKWYLAVLIGNQSFQIKEIEWKEEVITDMRRREVDFWQEFVINKIMPMTVTYKDTDVLAGLFPVAEEGTAVALSDEANVLIEGLDGFKKDAIDLEKQIETSENKLKAMLGEAEMGTTSLYKVGWRNIASRRFDLQAFAAQHPDLCRQFKPEKISRRFNYGPLKGDSL